MDSLFKSEKEAIEWVKDITPFVITPKRKSKSKYVSPFTSVNAFEVVTDIIGKSIYEFQENSKIATNKDL